MPPDAARRLQRLAEELEEAGLLVADGAFRELLVEEIDLALRPVVHERRVASGGTIIEPRSDPATWAAGAQLEITPRPARRPATDGARRFADGLSSWLVRRIDGENEWMVFDRPAGSERDLVVLAGVLDATIVQRHPTGAVRVVGPFGVLRWRGFSWHHEPPVVSWIDAVTASPVHGDPDVLEAMLEFAVHELGSRGIGSLLIYRPDVDDGPPVEERLPTPPPLQIRNASHLAPLRHAPRPDRRRGGVRRRRRVAPARRAARAEQRGRGASTRSAAPGTRRAGATATTTRNATVIAVSDDGPVTVLRNGDVLGRSKIS